MKKASSLLVMMVLFAFLVGCTSPPGGGNGGPPVVLWIYADNNRLEWQSREAQIETKFGIDLQIELVNEFDFINQLHAAVADGTAPDIIEWRIGNNQILSADPEECWLVPLDDYTSVSTVFANLMPARASFVTCGGHVYGLPHDAHPVVLIYNHTLWNAAGVDLAAVETWDDFFTAAATLMTETGSYALPEGGGLDDTMYMIWQQTGAQILDASGNPTLNSTDFVNFVQWWVNKINSGVMCSWDWVEFRNMLTDGTLAAYISPDWFVNQVNNAVTAGEYEFRVRLLPRYAAGGARGSSWGGSFMGIVKGAEDPSTLYQIIEYMQYDQTSMLNRYQQTGLVPPVSTVWSDSAFSLADSRFGGAALGEIQTQACAEAPSVTTGDIFWDALNDFNIEFPKIFSQGMSVQTACDNAQATAELRL